LGVGGTIYFIDILEPVKLSISKNLTYSASKLLEHTLSASKLSSKLETNPMPFTGLFIRKWFGNVPVTFLLQ
jgi:hypothetical protein